MLESLLVIVNPRKSLKRVNRLKEKWPNVHILTLVGIAYLADPCYLFSLDMWSWLLVPFPSKEKFGSEQAPVPPPHF